MSTIKKKLLIVVGPTSSGKSALAISLARRFGGEVVSADSRQVYRCLDIATGKVTKREMSGIRHHLLDVADPRRLFSVAQYKRLADKAIADIHNRGMLPILCGGTGYYIQAVVDDVTPPAVSPDLKLRLELEHLSPAALFERLRALDQKRALSIDRQNPRRLIRAIEIASTLGAVPKIKRETSCDALMLGLALPKEELRERIRARLISRLRHGMVAEARRLHGDGLTYRRMEELGLECRYLARHLEGALTREELEQVLGQKIWQYARRQMTWLRRDPRIHWFPPEDSVSINIRVNEWLSQ